MDTNESKLRVVTIAQYVKGVTFKATRNKLAKPNGSAPNIDYNLGVQKIAHEDDTSEVTLQIQIASKINDDEIFSLTLEYAGLFKLEGEVLESIKDEVLSIDCVTLLFPFARRELANILVSGGFQTILLDPIDFRAVYTQYKKQEEKKNLEEFAKVAMEDS